MLLLHTNGFAFRVQAIKDVIGPQEDIPAPDMNTGLPACPSQSLGSCCQTAALLLGCQEAPPIMLGHD